MSRNLGLPGFDEGRGKSSERTIELRAALGYVALMAAKIYSLSREVREAALDLKAIQRRIRDAGHRAYEYWLRPKVASRDRVAPPLAGDLTARIHYGLAVAPCLAR